MPAFSLADATKAATPTACKALLAQGVTYAVAVENARGEWFLLHGDDLAHAKTLARVWVEQMNARGASCWAIMPHGLKSRPCATRYAQPEFAD